MCNNHACNGHACNSRACNSHAWWYTRRVCSTPREIVVHANTLREYLKISRGATHFHACKNEVIIELYRMYIRTVPPRGNIALARIFLSSGEFDLIVSRVHLLFYNTNSEKLQWIYAHRPCHSTS